MKNRRSIILLTSSAMFAALIAVTTAYLLHIPYPNDNYIHLGDMFIYIAASFLPLPYAVAASAIGAGLGDLLSGFPIWIIPTVIIKSLMALMFKSSPEKILTVKNMLGALLAGIICVAGYYLASSILEGNFVSALSTIPFNAIQAVANGALFIAASLVLDKVKIKNKINVYFQ